MTAQPPDIDALLEHADWLVRLGRQLCRDQHAADDAAQETLLASLRKPPQHAGNLRGFLANALRNVLRWRHRADDRRGQREHARRPAGFAESAEVAAARAEIHQALGRFVLGLPEPQRALVLLYYFEGEDIASIAKHSGMTVNAVHGHLRRARDTLRTKLQSSCGDGRPGAALLLLTNRPWLVPTILMTLKTKVVTASVATAAAAVCIWLLQSEVSPPAPGHPAHAAAAATPASADITRPETPPLARSEVAAGPAAVPVPARPRSANGRLSGTVVDYAWQPVAGARVYALPLRDGKVSASEEMRAESDAHGKFEMETKFDAEVLVVAVPLQQDPAAYAAHGESRGIVRLRTDLTAASLRTTITRHQDHSAGELRLPAAAAISGVVRTPRQVPVAGVPILWAPDLEWDVSLGDFGVGGVQGGGIHIDIPDLRSRVRTDAAGRFVMPTTGGVSGWLTLMSSTNNIEYLVEMRKVTAPAEVVFDLAPSACVRVLTEGRPTPGVWISFDKTSSGGSYQTDAAGEVRVLRERAEPLRGKISRAGRAALEFDVPAEACPEQPMIVSLDTSTAPLTGIGTLIQVTITSEIPLRKLNGWLSRRDQQAGGIVLRPEPGDTVIALTGKAPPGRYRLTLGYNHNAAGTDRFVLNHVQEVTVGSEPLQLAAHLQHGGLIRCAVRARDGLFVGGKARLVAADGTESLPSFDSPINGLGRNGHLWGSEPSVTFHPMPPGRYELVLDLGSHGTHRRFVDVRACETAEVAITLP
ncbi:MAG TPA: sigma-70 family RNA polymerase sigma factor [Planctomycetota bacterium]